MAYQVKTPWWLSHILYSKLIWKMPGTDDAVYLTFDDGPHPMATAFVLEQLKNHNALATFFCIGKNSAAYPELHQQIVKAGHTVGNHTHDHLNGWNSKTKTYLKNIIRASDNIKSHLFRPPYGRIKRSQANRLLNAHHSWHIYMWDVLSGDFDTNITPEKCLQNVLANIEPGSIIVFHDSEKAWERMSYALPQVLQYCKEKNWELRALPKT